VFELARGIGQARKMSVEHNISIVNNLVVQLVPLDPDHLCFFEANASLSLAA